MEMKIDQDWLRRKIQEDGEEPDLSNDYLAVLTELRRYVDGEKELKERITELEKERDALRMALADKREEFVRMENAWRSELDKWYYDAPEERQNKSLLGKLSGQLKECQQERDALRDALAEIREVWAGSDGFIPETCPEGYLQKLVKDCYQIAVDALKGGE